MKRAVGLGLLGLMVSVYPGCGGSDSSPTTPVVTQAPAPVTTSLFSQGTSVSAAPAGYVVYGSVDVSVPYAGSVTVSFDWTFATSNIDLVVTRNDCTDFVGAYVGTCTALAADRTLGKPASATFNMTAAGVIRIWLYSDATVDESGVLNVTIVH